MGNYYSNLFNLTNKYIFIFSFSKECGFCMVNKKLESCYYTNNSALELKIASYNNNALAASHKADPLKNTVRGKRMKKKERSTS